MVLHGYKEYAAPALNFSDDYERNYLKAVEAGSAVSFKWLYQHADAIKSSDYAYLYAADYTKWLRDAAADYLALRQALAPAAGSEILRHETLASGVTVTRYQNGTRVYVNYAEEDAAADGLTVPARGFLTVPGEEG